MFDDYLVLFLSLETEQLPPLKHSYVLLASSLFPLPETKEAVPGKGGSVVWTSEMTKTIPCEAEGLTMGWKECGCCSALSWLET